MEDRAQRVRGPLIAFVISVVVCVVSYALAPSAFAVGPYPGPDALPGVPTYGGYLGTIPVGHHSHLSWICGLDAPNLTNHSPKYAIASIGGHLAAFLPISTQYGCAQFIVYASLYNAKHQIAPCGYAYVSVSGGPWIEVKIGNNDLLISGVKHYRHVGAVFPFKIPTPPSRLDYCPKGASGPPPKKPPTKPGHVTPPPPTIPGSVGPPPTYNASGTSNPVASPGTSPTTTLKKVTEVVGLIAVVASAGAAAATAGGHIAQIPESLVEEYASEIAPGGGLPFDDLPLGGVGLLSMVDVPDMPLRDFADVPPGGGYPYGSSVPEGSVSREFMIQMSIVAEEEEMASFFAEGTPGVPGGGGAPMGGLSGRTGGNESSHGTTSSGAGD